jgi:predicted methyltransferase
MLNVHPRKLARVMFLACVIGAVPLLEQSRQTDEARREEWQKVDQILSAMGVRFGATVADVGAGEGFFTSRLARAVGPDGRVRPAERVEAGRKTGDRRADL